MIPENDKATLLQISRDLKYLRFYRGIQRAHEPDGFVLEIVGDKFYTGSQFKEFLNLQSNKFDLLTPGKTGGDSVIWLCLFTRDWSPFSLEMTEDIAKIEQSIIDLCDKLGLKPRVAQTLRSRLYLLEDATLPKKDAPLKS